LVGLGGRFDATNVLEAPVACAIASLGIDHEAFLLVPEAGTPAEPLARIAFEKAGIAKPGVPLVTQAYPLAASKAVLDQAMTAGARPALRGIDWDASAAGGMIAYRDRFGDLALPLPTMPGAHQADNAALAVALLRHQAAVAVSEDAFAAGVATASWPGRLQRLGPGPLTALVPGRTVWLDGGHNPDAGAALARYFTGDVDMIVGMLASKNPAAIVAPLRGRIASLAVVPIPGHEAHPVAAFPDPRARAFLDVADALAALPPGGRDVLIAGSLYLAGEVLRLNRELPA
jgi:dihydrofolate synthase/folylpolyglutamate synthase